MRSAKFETSLTGFQPALAAQSSQKGEPVSGEKCQRIISRTCESREEEFVSIGGLNCAFLCDTCGICVKFLPLLFRFRQQKGRRKRNRKYSGAHDAGGNSHGIESGFRANHRCDDVSGEE